MTTDSSENKIEYQRFQIADSKNCLNIMKIEYLLRLENAHV